MLFLLHNTSTFSLKNCLKYDVVTMSLITKVPGAEQEERWTLIFTAALINLLKQQCHKLNLHRFTQVGYKYHNFALHILPSGHHNLIMKNTSCKSRSLIQYL